MKISYNWLKEHLPLAVPARDLAPHLLSLGFEVASLEQRGPAFTGVKAAQILAIDKHPNAERLSLCTVDAGEAKLAIVCGAKNIAVGQKVPLARIGAKLPSGLTIAKTTIRGVESNGMICSREELGLAGGNGGILVLDPATEVGSDIAASLGTCDDILEVEVTPNRPDCLSHRGLARELAAYFRLELKGMSTPLPAAKGALGFSLQVDAPQACPRYVGRLLEGIKVGPSPAWLAAKLESIGLRPINNVVDVTNFILMDVGQPMHAFDADKLEGGKVLVRWAAEGEKLKALDEKEYALSPECLVIADARKPVAIAGVMGGLETAVTAKTTRVFLESAYFAPPVVRKASQLLRLRSDSSYRFERGADVEAAGPASARAAALILELSRGGSSSEPVDAYPNHFRSEPIVVTSERLNAILGSHFPGEQVQGALKAIAARFEADSEKLRFWPPSYRQDLATPWDLAEEVGRLLGYDSVPAKASPVPIKPPRPLPSQTTARRLRERLAGAGFCEAFNYDFVSEKLAANARLPEDGPYARLANPLSEDWVLLRPTLLIGLLQNAAMNVNRGASSARLFELGKVYARSGRAVEESTHAAGLLFGQAGEAHWQTERNRASDFYDAKGIVADLAIGIPGLEWLTLDAPAAGRSVHDPLFHPKAALRLKTSKGLFGTVGLLHPRVARAWDLEREGVALFELALDLLADVEPPKALYRPYSVFPGSRRDLSFLVSIDVRYSDLEAAIHSLGLDELQDVQLVDLFTGQGVPESKQSLTVRLHFGREDRTLKDAEVVAAVERVLQELAQHFGAALRR